MAALPEEQRQAGNLEENVINHRIGDDEIDTDEDIEENQLQIIDRLIGHGSEKRSVEEPKWNQLKLNENGRID